MGRVVARVRELLMGQFVAEAAREIEVVAQQAGVPLALVRVLSADSLPPVLSTAGEPDPLTDRITELERRLTSLQPLLARREPS